MSKALIFAAGLLAMSVAIVAGQAPVVGTIEGTVVRQGTTEPLADVQISIGGSGAVLGARQAQTVLDAAAAGNPGISTELLQLAQNAGRGGARGTPVRPLTAVTDSAGRFVIQNVPVGSTVVRAQLQGYFGAPVGGIHPAIVTANVTVTADQPAQVRFSLMAGGSFSGRVLDPQGKPQAESTVRALQLVYQNGVRALAAVDVKPTDDRGEYRFFRLPPGEYFVAATPRRGTATSSDVPVQTLYPNVTDAASATPIVLSSGDEKSGINIQVRTAMSATVSGKVINNLPPVTGQRGAGRPWIVMLLPRGASALPDFTANGMTTVDPAVGTFEFANVAAGAYDLLARLPVTSFTGWGAGNAPALAANPWAFGRTPIEVRNGNVTDVAIVVHPGVDVTGQLIVDGKPAQANVRIGLAIEDSVLGIPDPQTLNTFGQLMSFQPAIGVDGSFTIPVVPEGKYRFQANVGGTAPAAGTVPPLPATAYVADIRQGSVSVYDNGIIVGRGSVDSIQVIVNTDGGNVEGIVAGADGKPVPSATVVLVPAPSRRQNPALYKMMRSDAQGRFAVNAVAPGQYKVFAWESVPLGAYQNAEFLARYEQRGVPVTLNPGLRATVTAGVIRDETAPRR